MKRIEHKACFAGWQDVYQHHSEAVNCDMTVGVYLPPQAENKNCPVLYWLSGLTCSEQNFITKAGAQRYAAEHGIILVAPDTSPRGKNIADDDGYDLGQGAGFYVNSTQSPWSQNYHMDDYIVQELSQWVNKHFPTTEARSISGHSMGGHGALVLALRNPGYFQSVSAFSPIVSPSQVPWGKKAFTAYLGTNTTTWLNYDSTALVASAQEKLPLLVDQGEDDEFLAEQLKPHLLEKACKAHNHPLNLRLHPGYDHSYYFIASFIGEHIAYHARALTAK